MRWASDGIVRARSGRLAIVVLCGHVLLVALLGSALAPTARWHGRSEPATPVWMHWLAPTIHTPQTGPDKAAGQPSRPGQALTLRPDAPPAEPALAPAAPPTAVPPPQAITVPEAPASRPPLDLSWRGARARVDAASQPPAAWVRDDPRVNRPPGPAERMARDLGADPRLVEEDRGEVRRFRQGSGCVDVRSARESQLNPWDQSAHPTPRQAKSC